MLVCVCSAYTLGNACRRPECPVNGHVKLSGIAVGSVVEYSCKDGYTMVGSPTARCLVSREWSDDTPACVLLTQHGESPYIYFNVQYL